MKDALFFAKFFGFIFAIVAVIVVIDATIWPGFMDIMVPRF